MKTAVITFPGSNCDRDMATALHLITGTEPVMVWHRETELPAGIGLVQAAWDAEGCRWR